MYNVLDTACRCTGGWRWKSVDSVMVKPESSTGLSSHPPPSKAGSERTPGKLWIPLIVVANQARACTAIKLGVPAIASDVQPPTTRLSRSQSTSLYAQQRTVMRCRSYSTPHTLLTYACSA